MMSIDVYIWAAACAVSLPSELPDGELWKQHSSPWVVENPDKPWWQLDEKDWNISVSTLPAQEAPAEVQSKIGHNIQGYSVILEGGSQSSSAGMFFEKVVSTIVEGCEEAAIESPMGISWNKK